MKAIVLFLAMILGGVCVAGEPDLKVGPAEAGRYYWAKHDRNLLRVADISAFADYLSTRYALRSCRACKEGNPIVRVIRPEGNLLLNLWINRTAMKHIGEPGYEPVLKFLIGTRFLVATLNIRVARK